MSARDLAVAAAGAAVAAAVTLWLTRSRRQTTVRAAVEPVLCFGDSLTEGYFNVWQHPVFGPDNPDDPAQETTRLRLHPYSMQLGARLAADAVDDDAGYASALRYAGCHHASRLNHFRLSLGLRLYSPNPQTQPCPLPGTPAAVPTPAGRRRSFCLGCAARWTRARGARNEWSNPDPDPSH